MLRPRAGVASRTWPGRSPPPRPAVAEPLGWDELLPLLQLFWRKARQKLAPRYAPGRLKQWLAMLTPRLSRGAGLVRQHPPRRPARGLDALFGLDVDERVRPEAIPA